MSGRNKPFKDPRGHSLRIYADVFDSHAFAALSPHDVLAYLALLRELKGYNNGDLSLPLSRAKTCGISHPKTLARSLRALCAVGLVAVTRKGGCTKGGQRLPTLYRLTDRECYAIPAKYLEAMKESHEWKRVTSVDHGRSLIQAAEDAIKVDAVKLKNLGHAVTPTRARREVVKAKARAPSEPWNDGLGHAVNMAENPANPIGMRVSGYFDQAPEKASHGARRSTPLYTYQSKGQGDCVQDRSNYKRLTVNPVDIFTNLIGVERNKGGSNFKTASGRVFNLDCTAPLRLQAKRLHGLSRLALLTKVKVPDLSKLDTTSVVAFAQPLTTAKVTSARSDVVETLVDDDGVMLDVVRCGDGTTRLRERVGSGDDTNEAVPW